MTTRQFLLGAAGLVLALLGCVGLGLLLVFGYVPMGMG